MVVFDQNFFLLEMINTNLSVGFFSDKEIKALEECARTDLLEIPNNNNYGNNRNNDEKKDNSKIYLDSASYSFCHMLINFEEFAKKVKDEREPVTSQNGNAYQGLVEEEKEEEEKARKNSTKTKKLKSKQK